MLVLANFWLIGCLVLKKLWDLNILVNPHGAISVLLSLIYGNASCIEKEMQFESDKCAD